ncbi:MAG: hypothetical protein EBU33_03305 [Sphingobacteriia bacterium]|nr:hypothetical protein [Sphingobacteriia bacterium]
MVPRDMQYKNLTVAGILATGKLSYSELKLSALTANIVASGPNTLFRKAFTTEELTLPGPGPTTVNYVITVDTTNSKVGDQLSIFVVTPFPANGGFLKLQFPGNNVFISNCGTGLINQYGIVIPNSRFLLNFVYTGSVFINCDDTN